MSFHDMCHATNKDRNGIVYNAVITVMYLGQGNLMEIDHHF